MLVGIEKACPLEGERDLLGFTLKAKGRSAEVGLEPQAAFETKDVLFWRKES